MALFGLFKKKGSAQAIAKHVRKTKERYAQADYRKASMEKLLDWGTKESITGVLQRFAVVVQSPHWDEDEKRWLVDELVKRQEISKEPLKNFLYKENAVSHAIEALSKICDKDEFVKILMGALRQRSVEDYRSGQGKREIIAKLGEYNGEEVAQVLVPYLDDHNDDVQCITIDVLADFGTHLANDRLALMITEDFQSARVLRHAASAVSKLKIPVLSDKPLVDEVAEEFAISAGQLVKAEEDSTEFGDN